MSETDTWENERSGDTWFNRWVTLHDDGSMSIEGQDLGEAPMKAFGGREYEFSLAVSPDGVVRFREVLDLAPSEPLLPALRSRFTSTGQIEQAIEEAGIDSKFWSRVGDAAPDEGSATAYLDRQDFYAWAFDDLLTNTTRGVLAEYIVAKALGILGTKRIEWDTHDLNVGDVGVEVKSAASVQSWEQGRPSAIRFDIEPKKGWDARTNTSADSARRSADVYVFCLLNGTDREHIDPLDVAQWTFYVLPTSKLDRKLPIQKTIRLEPLKVLGPCQCTYDGLKAAIDDAAAVNRGS